LLQPKVLLTQPETKKKKGKGGRKTPFCFPHTHTHIAIRSCFTLLCRERWRAGIDRQRRRPLSFNKSLPHPAPTVEGQRKSLPVVVGNPLPAPPRSRRLAHLSFPFPLCHPIVCLHAPTPVAWT
ncbi:unnamed protein product, partial [Ectocarpus sp. 8 AP-2014]